MSYTIDLHCDMCSDWDGAGRSSVRATRIELRKRGGWRHTTISALGDGKTRDVCGKCVADNYHRLPMEKLPEWMQNALQPSKHRMTYEDLENAPVKSIFDIMREREEEQGD
jgi:hypothetical protein